MKTLFSSAIILLFTVACTASEKVKAGFKVDTQSGRLPLLVSFEAAEDAPGVSYQWDFGNDSTSTRKSATTIFSAPGTYTVKLTVTRGEEIDSGFMSIDVWREPNVMSTETKKDKE